MKTLAVLSQKGGTGKTTIAVHLAVEASRSGKTVALIESRSAGFRGKMGRYAKQRHTHCHLRPRHSTSTGTAYRRARRC